MIVFLLNLSILEAKNIKTVLILTVVYIIFEILIDKNRSKI